MDYEKKYKEALGWMQSLYDGLHGATKEDAEHYFPELRESEDERIRKTLVRYHKSTIDIDGIKGNDILAWLEKHIANPDKTYKNDTLLDLLRQMPSCITVEGIDYHFVLKKTIVYMAYYEGEGEGYGKVIFWMAGEPIVLLTAMIEKLKNERLIE